MGGSVYYFKMPLIEYCIYRAVKHGLLNLRVKELLQCLLRFCRVGQLPLAAISACLWLGGSAIALVGLRQSMWSAFRRRCGRLSLPYFGLARLLILRMNHSFVDSFVRSSAGNSQLM